eukprot:gnl/MRDRNA2_/MRDRNA2_99230_c0_seq1.p1 gnl/MRDRNA2_/MRDRNA2_99230_c0~~gnl/MRDRNA2_/MRDRNA2_99230_c0_seq1.p1  ORF type:complete len:571 (-),score=116.81 gnl/MRDRNA2_/MRDRNA2_99230_c0_seq1:168-1796(-)
MIAKLFSLSIILTVDAAAPRGKATTRLEATQPQQNSDDPKVTTGRETPGEDKVQEKHSADFQPASESKKSKADGKVQVQSDAPFEEAVPVLTPDSIYEPEPKNPEAQDGEAPFIQLAKTAPGADVETPQAALKASRPHSESTLVEMSVAGDGHMEREKIQVPAQKRRHLTQEERAQVAGFGVTRTAKEHKQVVQKVRKAAATTTEAPEDEELLETHTQQKAQKLSGKAHVLVQGFDAHVPGEANNDQEAPRGSQTVRVSNVAQRTIRVHDAKPHHSQEATAPTVRAVVEPQPAAHHKRLERRGPFGTLKMAGPVLEPPADPADPGDDSEEPPEPDQEAAPPPLSQDPASQQKDAPPASQEAPEATAAPLPTATAQPEGAPKSVSNKGPSTTMTIIAVFVMLIAVCVAIFVILGSKAQVVEWGQATVATITGRRGEGADRELSEKRHLLSGPQKVMLNTQRSTPSDAGNRSSGGHTSENEKHSGALSAHSSGEFDGGRMKSAASHLDRAARQQIISGADSSAGSGLDNTPAKPTGKVSRPPRS